MAWVATAYGVVDGESWTDPTNAVDLVVLPALPAEPMGLAAETASLWRRLVNSPVADDDLTAEERELVREFEAVGIAAQNLDHPARVQAIAAAWLTSPMHELVNALIASIIRDCNLSALIIKGPALHKQGLRQKDHSGDVDLWVGGNDIAAIVEALTEWGWTRAEARWESSAAYHSFTLRPGDWGCEIDVHRHMPGFARADSAVLELLLQEPDRLTFAGVEACVPAIAPHAVINALHLLRPQQGRPLLTGTYERAVSGLRTAGASAVAFAQDSGADGTLAEALSEAFPELDITPQNPIPLNWRWRAEPNRLKRYVILFRSAPIAVWPQMAFRAVWPRADEAMMLDRMYGGNAKTPVGARIRRLGRGIRQQFQR